MPKRAETRAGRPARLRREQVLRAAIELADEGGLEALTMAKIGAKVGAEAMSLYRHVQNKEDVLDGVVDLVFAQVDLPPRGVGWRTALRRWAISVRGALSRHRWAIGLMESRGRPGPADLGHHDAVLGVLMDAGFTSPTAVRAYNLLNSYIYGFALQERSLPFATSEEIGKAGQRFLQQMPAEGYPHLAKVAVDLMSAGFVYANEFEPGLDLILSGLERLRKRATRLDPPSAVEARTPQPPRSVRRRRRPRPRSRS